MTWGEIIACYGAALSSILAWRAWRKDRRTIKITAVPAVNASLSPEGSWIRVSLQNRGFVPVHIRVAGIFTRMRRSDLGAFGWRGVLRHKEWRRSWWYLGSSIPEQTVFEPALPQSIEPGRHLVIWLPANAIRADQERVLKGDVRLFVQDEWDRTFMSGKLPRV